MSRQEACLSLFPELYGVVGALSPALQIRRMRHAGSSESLSRGYVLMTVLWWAFRLSPPPRTARLG